MTERIPEIALSSEEVAEILTHCGDTALLVGGQALAFWAARYAVKAVGVLATAVTSDVDFIGTAKVAANLGRSLGWQIWVPARGDPTAQVAKLTKTIPGVGIKQIDFLNSILGLQTNRVEQRAAKVTFPNGARIRVLHPLDMLESRLRNILIQNSQQAAVRVAQASLAISVTGSYLRSIIEDGTDKRVIYDVLERIAKIVLNRRLAEVCVQHDLYPLLAVPTPIIPGDEVLSRRLQQVLKQAGELKKKILTRAVHKR